MPTITASNKFILLIAYRDLYGAGGEWQLIANRAQAIYEATGLRTRACALVNLRKRRGVAPVKHPPGLLVDIIDSSAVRFPLAALQMRSWIRRHREGAVAVVLSSFVSYLFFCAVRRWGVPVLTDIHGAIDEFLEYPYFSPPLSRALAYVDCRWESQLTPHLFGRLVVTEPLARHIDERCGACRSFVIPCGVERAAENLAERRARWRAEYGWEDRTVWVYCGGLSAWQNWETVVRQFAALPAADKGVLWMLTPNPPRVAAKCQELGMNASQHRCEFLSPQDLEERLPAGDVGFLLRDDKVTNRVAFPNKFAQYVNAGLLTALSPALLAPAEIGGKYDVCFAVASDQDSLAAPLTLDRFRRQVIARANDLPAFYARCHRCVAEHLLFSTAVQPLAAAIAEADCRKR